MRLYVPQPGEAAILLQPWTFTLHPEHRNVDFHHAFDPSEPNWGTWQPYPLRGMNGLPKQITLPVGTELVFDRVYVRQGAEEYASLTFVVKACPTEAIVGERFWAKLDDANAMDIERTTSGNPIGAFARGAYRKAIKEAKDPELARTNAQKRADMKASKEALAAARAHVESIALGPVNMHLEGIITEALRELQARYPGWPNRHDRASVKWDMSRGPCRANDPPKWACKTLRGAGGDVIRELRYVVDPFGRSPKKLGGFRLTMRGTQVLSCEPLE